MKISKLEEKLYDFFVKQNTEIVVAINGEWGSGKTYFWKSIFLDKYKLEFKDKQISYVSLFGHNSLNDIKTDIILQISKHTKYISKIQDKVKSLKGIVFKEDDVNISLGGGVLSAGLSLLSVNDFKNIIICFDDFERLSSQIEIKDLMGFISNLKEQKQCKIVMILNEEELKKIHQIQNTQSELDTFSLYKEKIVDFEFLFENDINDFIESKVETAFDKSIIYSYFSEYQINNFRIIKQLTSELKVFNYTNIDNISDSIKKDFVYILFSILYLKKKYNLSSQSYYELKKLQESIQFKSIMESTGRDSDEDVNLTRIQEEQINYMVDFTDEDIETLIWQQIENERDIRNELKEILKKLSLENQINQDKDTIMNNWNKLHIDFSYTIENFIQDIKPILEKENIDEILNLSDYHFFVSFIKRHDCFDDEKIEQTIKKYIDKTISQEKSISIHEQNKMELIKENYPDLLEYLSNKKEDILIKDISCEDLKNILDKVRSGLGEKDEYIINNISKEQFKKCILSSSEIIQTIVDFLKSKKNNNDRFKNAFENIVKVLEELKNENDNYKFKIEQIFKSVGLK